MQCDNVGDWRTEPSTGLLKVYNVDCVGAGEKPPQASERVAIC